MQEGLKVERVRIKAREKKRPRTDTSLTSPVETSEDTKYNQSITVRYGTALYDTIQNIIESSHAAQDFTYITSSDFVRAALKAYQDGMQLTALDEPDTKRETKLRVSADLKTFYQSLPKGIRNKLLERAIRTYMKNL